MELAQTREELLESLIYRQTPRAFDNSINNCVYDHDVHSGCAIGCQLTPEELDTIRGEDRLDEDVYRLEDYGLLPIRLTNMGLGFLSNVQSIHDTPDNWINPTTAEKDDDGLVWSMEGKEAINDIINDYGLELPLLEI